MVESNLCSPNQQHSGESRHSFQHHCRAYPRRLCRLRLKCDGTRAETRFRLSAKRMSPFKWAGVSVQSTTGSRGVRISGSNAGCTMFQGVVKGTGNALHLPVSPSLPLPCVTVCHHISTGLYLYLGHGSSLCTHSVLFMVYLATCAHAHIVSTRHLLSSVVCNSTQCVQTDSHCRLCKCT